MLIPASKQRAVSDAVTSAKEAERDRALMEAAMYAIPRARELYEACIEKSAASGSRMVQEQLGFKCGSSSRYNYGCVAEALEEKYGNDFPETWHWPSGLKGDYDNTKRWRFVHEMWVDMVEQFIADLRDNGYKVNAEKTPEELVESNLKVSW